MHRTLRDRLALRLQMSHSLPTWLYNATFAYYCHLCDRAGTRWHGRGSLHEKRWAVEHVDLLRALGEQVRAIDYELTPAGEQWLDRAVEEARRITHER